MLVWALVFLVAAVVAAVVGFTGIGTGFASVAKLRFFLFVILFSLTMLANLVWGRSDR